MPPSTTRRRRAEHLGPERRRPQILDAALEIAVNEGISSVTIASVAEKLDVTRPVIYTCFANRVDLIAELVRREEERLNQTVGAVLRRRAVNADAEVFVEGFRALLSTVVDHPNTWRLVYGAPDSAVAEYFGRGRAASVKRCTELLRPTLLKWGMPADEVAHKLGALVELWVSSSEGMVRTYLADSSWDPDELAEFMGTSVYRALRTTV
ncbi:TetR/AcrR family transcriptional regulator [Gordonia hydrophobica]|uniref:TetR/AcrR family transcriptional regulator n=1 Tax=Gordonia hydrophobica TaxID=40516 RepID=A0ABZ2U6U5_9ACTN|nr:TetR/AcrR family transcriptional regulator [Gordonia hydrophobica]MBM7365447.1 AcrR family transcriptional regulator [Gordonia hydrophobica]